MMYYNNAEDILQNKKQAVELDRSVQRKYGFLEFPLHWERKQAVDF
jgi:hypothetical protein